jgi:hypothetical protein
MTAHEFDLVYLAAAMFVTMVLPIVLGLIATFQDR